MAEMTPSRTAVRVFVSYSHKDEDHQRRLAAHLEQLQREGQIDAWDDRKIPAAADWDDEIAEKLQAADIVLLLLSENFLASKYVREKEIPQALALAEAGRARLLPVILEPCEWKKHQIAQWQAVPQPPTPISEWPSRDVAYAEVARAVLALAQALRTGLEEAVEGQRRQRTRTVYGQYPFRLLGEDYDPFRALQQVFRRVEHGELKKLPELPLARPLEHRVEFVGQDYQMILNALRHAGSDAWLPYDLVAIPYAMLGHCAARKLIQPLDEALNRFENQYAWWDETGTFNGQLYGVPLSALSMILAIREDLFAAAGLAPPDTWQDYVGLIETLGERPVLDPATGQPVPPDLLQGRSHVTLWYDWLNHLYAHEANDRELYGDSRLLPRDAAETLRLGTVSYFTLARSLARWADGTNSLPHWATANWDDGIALFAEGKLLMHFVFNDALDTLRRRMEVAPADGDGKRRVHVRYLPVPRSINGRTRHGHVEGWVLCIPRGARYWQAANEVLEWFLDVDVQRAYAQWGGASAHLDVIRERTADEHDRGAGRAYWESVKDSAEARATAQIVKYKGPQVMPVVDRIIVNLYDGVLAVGRGQQSPEEAADLLVTKVEQRLRRRPS